MTIAIAAASGRLGHTVVKATTAVIQNDNVDRHRAHAG